MFLQVGHCFLSSPHAHNPIFKLKEEKALHLFYGKPNAFNTFIRLQGKLQENSIKLLFFYVAAKSSNPARSSVNPRFKINFLSYIFFPSIIHNVAAREKVLI